MNFGNSGNPLTGQFLNNLAFPAEKNADDSS